MEQCTIAELLDMSKQHRHLMYAYREIRQEVAFLSALNHPHLTELCGVRTHPYMCLLLELAPKKSLRAMLKDYREYNLVLEPLTLKNTTRQVSVIRAAVNCVVREREVVVPWSAVTGADFMHGGVLYHLKHLVAVSSRI